MMRRVDREQFRPEAKAFSDPVFWKFHGSFCVMTWELADLKRVVRNSSIASRVPVV